LICERITTPLILPPLVGRIGRFALKYLRVNGGRRRRAAKEAP
jgi:hypothetical protein